ncbi:hypothetical protein H0X32_01790 [Patescibacteria group bacterium]|nr:hypothetical protein [Patescibacteria group bacterium]
MFSLISFFAAVHTLGALIGTGSITFAEVFYTKAAADGRIDHHERKYLRRMLRGLTLGILLIIISGSALMVLEYLVPNASQAVLTAPFWALQTLTLLIIIFANLLSKDFVAWWFGSVAILVAWWMILLIDLGFLNSYGYLVLLVAYLFMTFVVAGMLGYLRVVMRAQISH